MVAMPPPMILLAAITIDQIVANIITFGTILAVFAGAVASTARRIKTGDAPSEPHPLPLPHEHAHDSHAWEMLATERHENIELLNDRIMELTRQNRLMRRYIPDHVLEANGIGHDDDQSDLDATHADDPKTND